MKKIFLLFLIILSRSFTLFYIHADDSNILSKSLFTEPYKAKNAIEKDNKKWIELAYKEAIKATEQNNYPFGAVLVQIDNQTNNVIRYWADYNHVLEWHDPTAHAEIVVIRTACKELGVTNLGAIHKTKSLLSQSGETSHCELYSNFLPCTMCMSAVIWAKIPVVYFVSDEIMNQHPQLKETYETLKNPYDESKVKIYPVSLKNSSIPFNLWEKTKHK